MNQPDLFSRSSAPSDPALAHLIAYLQAAQDWTTSAHLCSVLNLPHSESGRRQVRHLADLSAGLVISGQRGYRHIHHATADEIDHAAAWLESQGQKMIARALQIRRHAHTLVG